MYLIKEIRELSSVRKHNQLVGLFLILTNALLVAYTLKAYVAHFGANGLVVKDYIIQVYSLLLLVPLFGRLVSKSPMITLKIAIAGDVLVLIGYTTVNYLGTAPYLLVSTTVLLVTCTLMVRPSLEKVNASVNNGCPTYSLLKVRLDAIYTALGAGLGLSLVYLDVSNYVTLSILTVTLLSCRHYRLKVFRVIYGECCILERGYTPSLYAASTRIKVHIYLYLY